MKCSESAEYFCLVLGTRADMRVDVCRESSDKAAGQMYISCKNSELKLFEFYLDYGLTSSIIKK